MNVPAGFTLLLGGARSGKSALAVALGRSWEGPVTLVATARLHDDENNANDGDHDLAMRVARHQAERPARWTTVETAGDVVGALRYSPSDTLVIVDCITLWVAAAFDQPDELTIEADALTLARVAASRPAPTVLISNEVGLGVHPSSDVGRRFRDTLGRVNTTLAAHAHRTLFLVAGRALRLDDPWSLLT